MFTVLSTRRPHITREMAPIRRHRGFNMMRSNRMERDLVPCSKQKPWH